MKLAGDTFLAAFGGRTVNTHPALSPSFPGMQGPADALAYGVKVTGATLFVVDAGVDTGPIVAQVAVPVEDDDDVETLHERIKVAERSMLVDTVGRMAREGFTVHDRKVRFGRSHWLGWPHTTGAGGTPPGSEVERIERLGASSTRPMRSPMPNPDDARLPVRRALVSVYDKTGLDDLARALHEAGVALVSTGSTAGRIADAGVPVTKVEDLTGFPECLDGRVKTLHPKVHAGILADRRLEAHRAQLDELGIEPFDLVVSNLYPFTDTVTSGASPDECIEQIDIGGPSMVRAAAKNHPSVAIVTSPAQYDEVLAAVARGRHHPGAAAAAGRRGVRAHRDVRRRTSRPGWATWSPTPRTGSGFPAWVGATWDKAAVLRYGENPHQRAALYTAGSPRKAGWRRPPSCTARRCPTTTTSTRTRPAGRPTTSTEPAVAIIKHANPCGIAVGADVAEAHRKAHACDPVSAFGGVIATNVPVSVAMAEQVAEIFTEVVVAPGYEDGAVEVLAKKKNIRLIECAPAARGGVETRPISGGMLMQARDAVDAVVEGGGDDPSTWTLVTGDPGLGGAARRPRVRLAGLPGGEVQRDPARLRTAPRSASGWGRSTGSTPAGSPWSGRGSGPPARSPPATRSSRSRTARRSSSTRASRRSCSPAARCATPRSSTR